MTSIEASAYIDKLGHEAQDAELQTLYRKIAEIYKRKLWHQLTVELEKVIKHPCFKQAGNTELLSLYQHFIRDFQTKLNELKLASLALTISLQYSDLKSRMNFLAQVEEAVKGDVEAHTFLSSEIAFLKLQLDEIEEGKKLLDECQKVLDGVSSVDSIVYSSFYRAYSEYNKIKGPPSAFYKNSLSYLAYTPLDSLQLERQQALAFEIGLSALLGHNIYSFGELIAHPILGSLKGTKNEWMADLLNAFNVGDIDRYHELVSTHKAKLEEVPVLVSNRQLLAEKIAILSLMELVFSRPNARKISFADIASRSKLTIEEVEIMVMKALSLDLVRGVIDQIDQVVNFTWVQPRVLNIEQTKAMKSDLQEWTDTVQKTLLFLENETPELLV